MGYTEFTDGAGRSWRVWQTVPEVGTLFTALAPGWTEGWLTFESEGEKRRLAPIPAEWESLPPQRLELLCRMAEPSTQSRLTHAMLGREERKQE